MDLTDPIGPEGVEATKELHYDGYTPDDTLAHVLANLVAGQIQPQIDELSDDQWELLTAVGGTEEIINPAFEHLRSMLQPAIDAAITRWRIFVFTEPEDPVNVSGPGEHDTHWTVSGDLRTTDHEDGNYAWSAEIKKRVQDRADLVPDTPVMFDTEFSCFFAYTPTKAVADLIADIARDVYRTWTPEPPQSPEHSVGYYPEN